MAEHDAPFAHVAYQQPDGTTGVMDNCDAEALHDEAAAVKTENIADGAVTNGKIAAGAVTSTELADGAVTQAAIADGAVGKDQLSQELQESWDSISSKVAPLRFWHGSCLDVSAAPNDIARIDIRGGGATGVIGLVIGGPNEGKLYVSYRNSENGTWRERYI